MKVIIEDDTIGPIVPSKEPLVKDTNFVRKHRDIIQGVILAIVFGYMAFVLFF